MAFINFRERKREALRHGDALGIERAAFVSGTHNIRLDYRGRIVVDVHRTLDMMARTGFPIPRFLTDDNYRGINTLLGVEGFLIPARPPHIPSYNDLRDESFSGIFQFGPNTFGAYAGQVAQRLNDILANPTLRDSAQLGSLRAAIQESGLIRNGTFSFDENNIWRFYNNPMVQTAAAIIHHGDRLQRIQRLGPERDGIISRDQQIALFTISHNIPALSNLMMDALEGRNGRTMGDAPPERLAGYQSTNPALYRGTTSFHSILDRVVAYAQEKGRQMQGFGQVAHLAAAHNPPEIANADREKLNQLVRMAVEGERRRPGVSAEDRDRLGEMIKALDAQEVQDQRERGYEIRRDLARGDPHYRLRPIQDEVAGNGVRPDPIGEFIRGDERALPGAQTGTRAGAAPTAGQVHRTSAPPR